MTYDRSTAIHEAGHVVACLELDVAFDLISVVARDCLAGRVGVEGDDGFFIPPGTDPNSPENERGFRAWAERQAIIDYAGHAALVALLGAGDMSHRSAVESGAGPDYKKASRRLGHNRRRMAAAKSRAIEIVQNRADHVREIAQWLVEHGTLDEQCVDVLLEAGASGLERWLEARRP